jgi:hypothetical protein
VGGGGGLGVITGEVTDGGTGSVSGTGVFSGLLVWAKACPPPMRRAALAKAEKNWFMERTPGNRISMIFRPFFQKLFRCNLSWSVCNIMSLFPHG